MPKNSKVHKMYQSLLQQGMPVEKAVKIAQSQTKQALATGKKPKVARVKTKDKSGFHKPRTS